VWQNPHPVAMMRALNGVIHDRLTPKQAFDLFETIKQGKA
jgi:putative autoinducer-2 (AI-2) aldolase